MVQRFFPEINKFWRYFPLSSKRIIVGSLRLSKRDIKKFKIFLFVSGKDITQTFLILIELIEIRVDGLKPTFVSLVGFDSLFRKV